MRKLAVFALFILVAASLYAPISYGADDFEIRTVVTGPDEVLAGENYDYTVTIVGAPDADKWSCEVTVSDGGSATPSNYSSDDSNVLTIHITAPSVAGDFTITVNGTADIEDNTYWNRVEYKVKAVSANTVDVPIYNAGKVNAHDVRVSLYIDGKYQYSTTVDVDAGKTTTATLKWNPLDFSDGVHTMEIVIDPASNLTFEGGKTVLVKEIYIGEQKADHTSLWIALAIVFAGTGTLAFAMHSRKKKRMPKRKKW